jgi:hypothetical protein
MQLIMQKVKQGVLFYNSSPQQLNAFASKGVPDAIQLFSVIDVKKVTICKLIRHHRSLYSGHKKIHCLKY